MPVVVSPVYDDTLGRVRCYATGIAPAATSALFEWSVDQISWSTIRGGTAVPVVAGAAGLDHYEFSPGVVNYYRVSSVDTVDPPTYISAGTAVTASNTSVTPGMPSGWTEGDLLLVWAAIRNSGGGSIVVPSNYVALLQADNICLMGRRASATETAPAIAVTGGVSGADVIAQMACARNAERTPTSETVAELNLAGSAITYPALVAGPPNPALALYLGWRQSSWTSVATISGATQIGATSSAAGTGAGLVWDVTSLPGGAAVTTGAFTVTGGSSAISYGAVVALRRADFITRAVGSIVPPMNNVWLKLISAPYCNRKITLTDWAATGRASRATPYPIVGSRDAVAVTDFSNPLTVTVTFYTASAAETAAIDLVLSLGNILLLHVPPTCVLPSMYAVVGNYSYERPSHFSVRSKFTVPLTQTTSPAPAIVGNTVTYTTLLNTYATYMSLYNSNASWAAVQTLVGSPIDALTGGL